MCKDGCRDKLPDAHSQQPQGILQINAFQAQSGYLAQYLRIGGVVVDGGVAGGSTEVGIAQLDADGFAGIALALQIGSHTLAQVGQDVAEFRFVTHRMQVTRKSGFTADAHRLAVRDQGAVIASPGRVAKPCAVTAAKMLHQPDTVARRQISQCTDAKCR